MKRKIFLWELCNFAAFFYCMFISITRHVEYGLFLIPLIYSILFVVCFRSRKMVGRTPGQTVIMGIMFCRYVILPIVLCSSGELSKYANNYKYMLPAVVIMIYEMISIFIVLELTAYRASKIYVEECIKSKNNVMVKPPFLIVLLICCIFVGIYLTNPNMLNGEFLFVANAINGGGESIQDVSGFVKILWQCITAWLFVYGINKQKDKYVLNGKRKHVGISIIFMLLFMLVTYIGQSRISRWYTVVSAITSIFILTSLFPSEKKIIAKTTIIPVVALILVASILKSGLYTHGEVNSVYSQLSELISPTSSDAYFAGPVSINNAIGMSKNNSVGLHNIVYDIFNNMPVVNHFIDTSNSTAYLYNAYLGRIFNGSRGDQIISLVGQSGIFFSWVLAPLLSCISVILLRIADKKYVKATSYMKYVWGFVAVWFGLETILNMTINLSWVYIRIIPMFAVFWLIEKISPKQVE
ncbi:hypothetical protein EA71_02019 [Enterococcus durans]|uniref:Oligosaccharide repeat unit polymerase n=2 Tax=Enterococcus durans TaxID=53345 RepID=A0A367CFC6_9ENTE|nr:hypothetical protein EA71_02019 [Enterococcus durans]